MDLNGIPQGEGALFATLRTTGGVIVVELFESKSPKAVANFVGLATGTKAWRDPQSGEERKGRSLYEGTTFHRRIENFMIQGGDPFSREAGGDPSRVGTGGPGYVFENESDPTLRFDKPGVVAMANSGKDANGSQFFITEVATPHLDGGYTIFGSVVQGFERVPKIARTPASQPVTIQKIVVSRSKY